MIQTLTKLNVADNTGAKLAMCIGFIGQKRLARVGSVISVTIKDAVPSGGNQVSASSDSELSAITSAGASSVARVRRGEVHRALVIRTRKEWTRPDGRVIRFGDNAAVLINKENKLLGTRIFGPVPEELRTEKWMKVCTLASRVV